MYCIKCNREEDGKYCPLCGSKMISSKEAWNNWKNRYSNYSRQQFQEMIDNSGDYQEDAVIAAEYLLKNYVDEKEQQQVQNDDNSWYYAFNGNRIGPISEAELLRLLETGHINENTQVWKQGLQNWVSITQSGIVMPQKDETVPPPLAVNQMNNKPIIFLLFVPIISSLIQFLIAGWFQIDANRLWWIAVGLNIFCCTMDYYRVKKAGYNADKLMAVFIFLIPLYIYKRMAMVNGKKWVFTLIWIAVFVLDLSIPATFWVKAVNMSNPAMISAVKDGSFYNFDDMTVGRMFDKALDDCEWNTYMGANRAILVQVEGEIDGHELNTVFELGMDMTFEISRMRVDGESCSNQEINVVLAHLYESIK